MKAFAVLIILAAFGMFGVHFSGLYAVPGLEAVPTVETLGKERSKQNSAEGEASGIFPIKAEDAPFKTSSNSASAQRKDQLEAVRRQAAGN